MADTTFVNGTPVVPAWLNDVNDFVYTFPTPVGNTGKAVVSNGTAWTAATVSGGARPVYYAYADYGITNDMSVDVSSALTTLINTTLPAGSTLVLDGKFKITSPLVITNTVSLQCLQSNNFIWASVGVGNDAVTYTGTATGLNNLDIKLNVYGPANACRYGILLTRVDRSKIYMNVRAGCVAYAFVLDGCLINEVNAVSSVNFAPPVGGYGTQLNHMLVRKNTTYTIASNTNDIYCLFEGCTDGYVQSTQPGEGSNTIFGEIEGLSGNAVYVEESLGFNVRDLKAEANTGVMYFRGCDNLSIGRGVINQGSGGIFRLRSCTNYSINNVYGTLDIDSSNIAGSGGNITAPNINVHTITDKSFNQTGPFYNKTLTEVLEGPGAFTMVNLFSDPYLDLYANNGTSSAPIGASTPSALISRVTSPLYTGNPTAYSCRVTTTAATITSGLALAPSFNPIQNDNYMSVLVPVRVAAGQPGVAVYLHDGTNFHLIFANTTTKDTWMEARGTIKLIAGNSFTVYIASWNGSTYPSGAQFYVGGCSMVYGAIPPKTLDDSGRRRFNIISTIANTPDFQFQFCKTAGGDLYISKDNASSADWLKVSP